MPNVCASTSAIWRQPKKRPKPRRPPRLRRRRSLRRNRLRLRWQRQQPLLRLWQSPPRLFRPLRLQAYRDRESRPLWSLRRQQRVRLCRLVQPHPELPLQLMLLLPHRPLVRRRDPRPLLRPAHPLRRRHRGLRVRSAHPCRVLGNRCARLDRLRLRKGTHPLHRGPLGPANAPEHRKACARRVPRSPIVQQAHRKVAPVVPPAKVVGPAVRRPVFRNAQVLAAPAVATTKLPWVVSAQVLACRKPSPANRCMRASLQRVAAVRLSRNVTPKVNANSIPCVHDRVLVRAAEQRPFNRPK